MYSWVMVRLWYSFRIAVASAGSMVPTSEISWVTFCNSLSVQVGEDQAGDLLAQQNEKNGGLAEAGVRSFGERESSIALPDPILNEARGADRLVFDAGGDVIFETAPSSDAHSGGAGNTV